MALLSTVRRGAPLSPALSTNNIVLNRAGVVFRRSQFSMVAAAPTVGKSLFATNLALRTKVPTLFLSADSDAWTVRTRACSILTGIPLNTVEQHLNAEDDSWGDWFSAQLQSVDHVDWCYQSDIDTEFIALRLKAYEEVRGYSPELIIVDNLGNTVADQANEYAELRGTCRELQAIARIEQAHVMALHHVIGNKEDGYQEIGLGDLLGKLGKIPEVVLGLNRSSASALNVHVAKNRGGPTGSSMLMDIDYPTATIGGYR